jgi:hypothetical protein
VANSKEVCVCVYVGVFVRDTTKEDRSWSEQ